MISNKYIKFIEIITYVLILAILGYWLKDFFRMSWEIGFIAEFVSTSMLLYTIAIISGIYFGIIFIILIKDDFKRIQGFFLLIISSYVFFYYLHHIFNNLFIVMISFVAASYYANKTGKPTCRYKFNNLPLKILFVITSIYILITVVNYLTYYISVGIFDEIMVYYMVYTIVFIIMFYKFMNYETGKKGIFVMGPPRVGKTVFTTALCDKVNGEPTNNPMRKALSKLTSKDADWPGPTDILEELRFNFKKGLLFTRCFRFSTFDYPGGFLFHQIKILFELLEQKRNELDANNFKNLINKIDLDQEIQKLPIVDRTQMKKIIEEITNAEIIVFIISALSIQRQDPDMKGFGLEEYIKIYELVASVTDKPFIICITKTDLEYGNKVQWVSIDSVAKIIHKDLRNLSLLKDKKALKRSYFSNKEYDTIFPCWVENEDGKPNIKNGKVEAVGHDELVKKL